MPSYGIYILANDVVYDQFVALVNSIEANVSPDLPICVIPYNDRLELIQKEIQFRPQLSLFENWEAMRRWDEFARDIWAAHSVAQQHQSHSDWYGGNLQRRLAAFEGDFDRFVYYDCDSLAMKPLDRVFERLDRWDFVFDDWEHQKPTPVAALNIPLIEKTGRYTEAEIRPKLHCGSFFASKRGLFDAAAIAQLKTRLIDGGEIEWINGRGWWDDAFLFCYLTLPRDRSVFNFTLSDTPYERTGNCADSDPFVNIDNILYNEQGLKPIHRIHYMNYPSIYFNRLSQGENLNIPHQDVFLHYRFLKHPEAKPKELKTPSPAIELAYQISKKLQKIRKKLLQSNPMKEKSAIGV
ncbi:Npun_R2821/Npun_R2822 family protein [Oxynema aestuarii]|uniref:Methionine synthase n=1 Tax=Oxynema aestuarii AP17 TaxID=2064643 RepID=A0A6H1U120_9CYAN|nr:Npun_R2821/Npun_R2822 family protein [Oxynema aestuarii]QIZ72531.1 methionine synthase [Oxynema aestuarii AP17]RMH76514.1 MAG: methionine synthase [Cyanobacteria bacterium J007]